MKKPVSPEAARLRMADLCARSEQCEADIMRKLQNLSLPGDVAGEIIKFLRENKFIDDERFARSFARDKCRFSSWGRNKIRLALMAKHIPADAIAHGLAEIDKDDYLNALRKVALAKFRQLDLTGEKAREDRMKLYQHIISRGFESSLASKAVASLVRRASMRQEGNDE
ncbi:MAG: RecX family transcriptional regulator [Muribaculaceae bacterium]|nr:RecX family transcriptional regulator [Muribaculaceae bacterium]MDE6753925.1 RecX family transcriptional regulator [Muribaculaceae bacterium]